jgi:hypothetical protein
MVVRLFECTKCGHKLRLGAENCGRCHEATPLKNRDYALGIAFLIAMALIFFVVIN